LHFIEPFAVHMKTLLFMNRKAYAPFLCTFFIISCKKQVNPGKLALINFQVWQQAMTAPMVGVKKKSV